MAAAKAFPAPDEPAPQLEDNDALMGGEAITRFVNQVLGTDYSLMAVYTMIYRGQLPGGKLGARVIGSKRAIRERLAQAAGLAA